MGQSLGDKANLVCFGKVGWFEGEEPKRVRFHALPALEGGWEPHQEGDTWQVGVQWDEPRDVYRVEVEMPTGGQPPKLQYWHNTWPHLAPERLPGARHSWSPVDDFFHGKWVTASAEVTAAPGGFTYVFDPLDIAELRDQWQSNAERQLIDSPYYEAKFRRALKLRLLGQGQAPSRVRLRMTSGSVWGRQVVETLFGCGPGSVLPQRISVAAYNGRAEAVWQSGPDGCPSATITIDYLAGTDGMPLGSDNPDRTIVTVRTDAMCFSFLVADVAPGKPVFVPDLGVMVVAAGERPDWQELLRRAEKNPSIYDRVAKEPQQTLQRAFEEIPALDVTKQEPFGRYMPLSFEGTRQEFALRYNGNLLLDKRHLKVAGRDAARALWPSTQIRYNFGSGDPPDWRERAGAAEQTVMGGYLPIVNTCWLDRDIEFTQTAFATPLSGIPEGPFDIRGDEEMVCLVRVTLRNATDGVKTARLWFNVWPSESLALDGGDLIARGRLAPDRPVKRGWKVEPYAEERLRANVCAPTGGFRLAVVPEPEFLPPAAHSMAEPRGTAVPDIGTSVVANSLLYEVELEQDECASVVFRIPFSALDTQEERRLLAGLDFEEQLAAVREYWEEYVGSGTELSLPDQILVDYFKAVRPHVAITVDRDPGSGLFVVPAATYTYGACGNEACLQIRHLDMCGHHERAERYLETFVATQGAQPLDGDFRTKEGTLQALDVYDGQFIGRHFSYNLDHGFIMECLVDHYRFTRDRDWLGRIAPNLIAACDFVTRERQATMRTDECGKRVAEYGLLPAGHLEDNQEWYYWFAVNAHAYGGMKGAAEILAEIGHPEAERLARDAEAYRHDIRRALEEARINSPVVRLRDGTYIPHTPTRAGLRGRDYGWFREAAYGPLHLVDGGVLDADEQATTWILKDLEDNLFVTWMYGWATDTQRYWFSRGGVTVQANLLNNITAYIRRGQPEHAVRSLFNDVGLNLYRDVRCATEHPVVEPGHGVGPNYKTPDECGFLISLRRCLVDEVGTALHLCRALPESWIRDGELRFERVPTFFGPISLSVSRCEDGHIQAEVQLPQRLRPAATWLHLRPPQGKRVETVWVDDQAWHEFDASTGAILLPADERGSTIVHAFYA